ncbi:hypothetical protein EJP02_267 [Escherichia phage EJP2]|nr:hypothetical protein EJP02_267 [Escherichia phage EJP2]
MSKKLPFWIIPAHWGLSGKAKKIAQINYYSTDQYQADYECAEHIYLTEYEIDSARNDIALRHSKIQNLEYRLNKLSIDEKHGRITENEQKNKALDIRLEEKDISEKDYDREKLELLPDGEEKSIGTIEYLFKYHEITEREYSKELYTLRKEPWMDFDLELNQETNEIELSFDYNEFFWKKLKHDGHPGNDEYEIIENFIRDWGRKMASDEYVDDYDSKLMNENTEPDLTGLPEGYRVYK